MRKTKSRERVRILSLVIVLLLLPTMMFAIPKSGKKVTLNLESVTVKEFFDALRQQTRIKLCLQHRADKVTETHHHPCKR